MDKANPTARQRELWLKNVVDPVVGVYRPPNPDGRALLVIPGGNFDFVSIENEGINVAKVLNPLGITVFVLAYRLPRDGWANPQDVPQQDAQRAMRLIRANAEHYGIDPEKVGVVGFSIGGLVAASLAVASQDPVYEHDDAADEKFARPNFAGLIYPVITADRRRIGKLPAARYDANRRVERGCPPLFIVHALDDIFMPPSESFLMLQAAQAAGVSVEAHFFEEGGHGFGASYIPARLPGSHWTAMFDLWIKRTLLPKART